MAQLCRMRRYVKSGRRHDLPRPNCALYLAQRTFVFSLGLPAAQRPDELRRSGAHFILLLGLPSASRLTACAALAHISFFSDRRATRAACVGGFLSRSRAGCTRLADAAANHRADGAIHINPSANLATVAISGAGRRHPRIALNCRNFATSNLGNCPARSAGPGCAAAGR